MKQKRQLITAVFLFILCATFSYGQDVLRLVPYDGTPESFLMTQILADTTATGTMVPGRIYELDGGAIYLNTDLLYVDAGETLRMRSSTNEKPIIYQYPTGTGSSPQNPPGYFVRLRGGNIEMTGIALSGFFEPIDSNFNNVQGNMIRVDNEGSSVILDDCLFTNINGQIIRTEAPTVLLSVKNCIFANLGSLGNSNLGAGKGIDLRATSCETLELVNNTFVNYQDRVVRHYNYGNPLAGTGNIEHGTIDHNTFVNGMGYHGLLSLGNIGEEMTITNNLFYDAFALGEDSTDATRAAEWGNTGEFYPNGNNRITWIFSAPNETTAWTISNNFYAISDSGQAFLDDFGFEEGSKLSWHISSRIGADSATAFTKVNITLGAIPALMTNMMRWYESPNGGDKTKNTPTTLWVRERDDMDRKAYSYFIDEMDISYGTESAAYTGALMGYPAGNLNAYPNLISDWENGVNLNSWLVYDASVLPSATEGLGEGLLDISKRSDDSPGAGLIEEIIDDGAIAGNKVLKYLHPDGKLTHQYVFDDNYAGTAFTMMARIKGENDPAYDRAFDIRWDNGNMGFRDELRIWAADSTIELEKVDVRVAVDMDLYDWHTYRITMDGDYCAVYIDENPVAVVEGTTTATTTNKYIKLGDGSGDAIGGYLDWFILDVSGAYAPGEGLDLPAGLYVDGIVGIDDDQNVLPDDYKLAQNYPNPFNPSTTISYSIPERSVVSLTIYNSIGQEVVRLIDNQDFTAGNYNLKWNAKDSNGHSLSSGIYFYQLRSNDVVKTKKMILLK